MPEGNQVIKCHVQTCKYNEDANLCSLDDIIVGQCGTNAANKKTETECDSFECR